VPDKGAVFVFEGPDGVGKSTLVTAVKRRLNGLSVLDLSFPGSIAGTLGAHVYALHHRHEQYGVREMTPDARQLLHVSAHVETIITLVRPHVADGGVVLLDRYWWSTWVYGVLSGVPKSSLKRMIALEQFYWKRIQPKAVFLVNRAEAEIAVPDRKAFNSRSNEYDVLARSQEKRVRVLRVDNAGDIESVADLPVLTILETVQAPKSGKAPGVGQTGAPVQRAQQLSFANVLPESAPQLLGADNLPAIWAKLSSPRPSAVFDTYWRFAAERQAIFFRRLQNKSGPWTNDPILSQYKFTNAYRASDRVSQFLIREVIGRDDKNRNELFFRILLFKFFNKIDTWRHLVAALGELTIRTFDVPSYDRILTGLMQSGQAIYSGAYIMPTGGNSWGEPRKHLMHLKLLQHMISQDLPQKVSEAPTMRNAFELLKATPTLGNFLAYQYVIDLNYSTATDFSESEFVVPGPGARDGIRKSFTSLGDFSEADVIRLMYDRQEHEFRSRGLSFQSLWGRPLQLIDCQNLFCEVDKYARVHHPEVEGTSGRSRIKQQFRPSSEPLSYQYPQKWEINHLISGSAVEPS